VLRKALAHGLKVVIVINKIDRENADPAKMYDKVLELLMELNATEEQFDAPVVYGSGRDGYMMYHLGEAKTNMTPSSRRSSTTSRRRSRSRASPSHARSNIDWSDYVGRIAVGKILGGTANVGDPVFVVRHSDASAPAQDHQGLRVHRPRHARDRDRHRRQTSSAFRASGCRHR